MSDATPYSSGAFVYCDPVPNPVIASISSDGDGGLIEFSHTVYDDSSNPIEQHTFEMNHDDGIDVDAASYVRRAVYSWYDEADRVEAMADYGSGDSTAGAGQWKYAAIPARPGTALTWTDAAVYDGLALLTRYTYDMAGRQELVVSGVRKNGSNTDKITTKSFYDDLGRKQFVAENWVDYNHSAGTGAGGGTNNEQDRVTKWTHTGLNQTATLTALKITASGVSHTAILSNRSMPKSNRA